MRYISTRGEAPPLGFVDTLLAGLARDGGLYLPETWPQLAPETIAGFAGRPYAEVAFAVMRPYLGREIAEDAFRAMVEAAYSGFGHPAVTPLVQIAPGHFLLELFHGPTLAFKDVAMQLLGPLMDFCLAKRGARATIVGATSGDTGGAAIEAFRGRDRVDVFVLFPEGRVSPVQRRQMTTVPDPNVDAIAIRGTFDDAQGLVKAMFNDHAFRDRLRLAGVNSINWARIMAQTVYYFVAAVALGAPKRRIAFSVPTGNFGDVFAGYVAARMGLPIARLVVATNVNDILDRTLRSGRYEVAGVVATASPSMDIQVSSNFERLLFEAHGRDASAVRRLMAALGQSGAFSIEPDILAGMRRLFASERVDEDETLATIARIHRTCGLLVDPHTAVGIAAAERQTDLDAPVVALATAHPAKFPEAAARATGISPRLPGRLADLLDRPERAPRLDNDLEAVEDFIATRSRAVSQA